MNKILQATTFVGAAQAAAMLARPRGGPSLAYRLARKPKWVAPDFAMAPLWVGGFTLLGLSGFAAWRDGARRALPLLAGYLAGNAVRSGHDLRHTGTRHVASIAALTAYAMRAGRRSPAAKWLALPYVAWLGYVALGARATRARNPLIAWAF